jgi:hypothetical protein
MGHFRLDLALRGMSNMPLLATETADIGQSIFCSVPMPLDVNLLRNGNGVVHRDAKVSHRALDFALTGQ